MLTGIGLPLADLPRALHAWPAVAARVYDRAGLPEARFLWRQQPACLPVWRDGSIHLVRWGSTRRRGTLLPYGGWVEEEAVKAGSYHRPAAVVIPAAVGEQAGVWFVVEEGVRGVLLHDRDGPAVYVLVRAATNYYHNMCGQAPTMPVLVNQVI